jgi:hypothetical protein
MRKLFALCACVFALALVASAQDDKKTTLEGKLVCTKCELKETKACGHALIVKKDDKEIKYYLKDKGGKEPYHGDVCQEPKKAKVTGKVEEEEKDGKKRNVITPEKDGVKVEK